MSGAYELTTEGDQIVIRLRAPAADPVALERVLDFIDLESIRRRSELPEETARTLASEAGQGAWERVRHLFPEGDA